MRGDLGIFLFGERGVDDDIDLLTSMAELLADFGYKVRGFSDADSALEKA